MKTCFRSIGRRLRPAFWIVVFTLVNAAVLASAQQYEIAWYKIAGGGGMQSTGGVYTLSGTIGQADAGRVAANPYRIEGGFWAIAIQQLGFPTLHITQAGTNAIVSWVTDESGLILQESGTLATLTAWADLTLPVQLVGATNSVAVPLNPAQRNFYRLRRP